VVDAPRCGSSSSPSGQRDAARAELTPVAAVPTAAAAEEELSQASGGLLIHRTKVSDCGRGGDGPRGGPQTRSAPRVRGSRDHRHCVPKPATLRVEAADVRLVQPAVVGLARATRQARLAAAKLDGWDGLRRAAGILDEFWDAADVRVEGTRRQQAVRFGPGTSCMRLRRAAPHLGERLTGPGHDGTPSGHRDVRPAGAHHTQPSAVRDALHWRHSPWSRRGAARTLNLEGAAFWRTIEGPSRRLTGRPAPLPHRGDIATRCAGT
jgi:alpha,alpha-trehalose phosphorylase